ncbi:redoxin domain-containing protein [Nocardioides sp.]|uniref:redoxin domain-containing protein n=1 Tax=Nocardioides sp. TaxID=35761 RepID=UPI0035676C1F
MPRPLSTVPADLSLFTPEGTTVPAADLADTSFTVVQLVRYFGCLPCQSWLLELTAVAPELAAQGIGVAAVGGSADYQAQWLRDEKRVTIPLYLDPGHDFRTAVGAERKLGLKLLRPAGAAAYVRSLREGLRPQAITRDTLRSPGVVILDRDLNVVWQHVGERIGDYPAMARVVAAVRALAVGGQP